MGPRPRPSTKRSLLLGAALALGSAAPASAGLTGVCPDGSMFIVQKAESIPCKNAKLVEPDEVPPIRPEYLPQPYTWQIYNQSQNPNNPYNLIDAAREIRALAEGGGVPQAPPGPGVSGPSGGGSPYGAAPPLPGGPAQVGPLDLGLSDEELQDLFMIVELSQEYVPARFRRETAGGSGVFEVSLARSEAFEDRLRDAWESRGGLGGSAVLIFSAVSKRPVRFHANLTFVQGHLTYQPDAANARQLGILQGRLGDLEGDELVLGYVVLPGQIDLRRELDVYWNDRRISVQF